MTPSLRVCGVFVHGSLLIARGLELPLSAVVAADGLDGKSAVATVDADSVTVLQSSGSLSAEGSVTFTLCAPTITPAAITSGAGTTTPTTTTTTTVPATVNLDTSGDESVTAPASEVTFTDTDNNLTIIRSFTETQAATTSANWSYMSVTYNLGSGEVTDTVDKTAGADTVGVLTRNSNASVSVGLASSVPFTLTVEYNGKSTGTTYIFPST